MAKFIVEFKHNVGRPNATIEADTFIDDPHWVTFRRIIGKNSSGYDLDRRCAAFAASQVFSVTEVAQDG